MTVKVRAIPGSANIHTVSSPSFFMQGPRQHIYSPIPSEVLSHMRPAHSTEYFEPRTVRFHHLQNVYVVAEGLVFDENGAVFLETVTQHSQHEIEVASKALSQFRSMAAPKHVIGPSGVLCVKRGSSNYGHWLMEMLPKAFLAKREITNTVLKFIVPESTGQLARVIDDTLRRIDINERDVIRFNATLNESEAVFFENLIVISSLTEHGTYMSPLVMDCMEALSQSIPADCHNKIFVTRTPGAGRRFENEEQFRVFLECSGFHLVDTSALSFSEQVATFKGASHVVGAMGAAMTNIAFCRPGAAITMLAPASMPDTFYWFLSGLRHLSYEEIRCAPSGGIRGVLSWDTDLILPRDCLVNLLDRPNVTSLAAGVH
jgi:capsular polysaccharide biosynthesis protein